VAETLVLAHALHALNVLTEGLVEEIGVLLRPWTEQRVGFSLPMCISMKGLTRKGIRAEEAKKDSTSSRLTSTLSTARLAILHIALTIEHPRRDLELQRVADDRHDLARGANILTLSFLSPHRSTAPAGLTSLLASINRSSTPVYNM